MKPNYRENLEIKEKCEERIFGMFKNELTQISENKLLLIRYLRSQTSAGETDKELKETKDAITDLEKQQEDLYLLLRRWKRRRNLSHPCLK